MTPQKVPQRYATANNDWYIYLCRVTSKGRGEKSRVEAKNPPLVHLFPTSFD